MSRSMAHAGLDPAPERGARLLDDAALVELRQLYRDGWKADALALAYGVSRRTMYRYLDPRYDERPTGRIHVTIIDWMTRAGIDLTRGQVDSLTKSLHRRLVVEAPAAGIPDSPVQGPVQRVQRQPVTWHLRRVPVKGGALRSWL